MEITVFIGASTEQDAEAKKIAAEIDKLQGFRAVPWNQGDLFTPGSYTLERLILIAQEVDAALFVFGQDDKVEFRGEDDYQPRDNVLIEYGLFLGQLGQEYVAFYRKGATRTARDVDGVTYLNAPKGWNNAVLETLATWLKEVQKKKRRMSERLNKILYPAIEFNLRFPVESRATARPEPILTDINEKGKMFFGIQSEDEYLGKGTRELMNVLMPYIDPPSQCWDDLREDQGGVYERIRRGHEALANIAIKLNRRHRDYSEHLFVPLITERTKRERLDGNIDELNTVLYLDISKLPKHVFGEQIWKDVSAGFNLEQLANELEETANKIEAAAPRIEKLKEAVNQLRNGGGPNVMELCSEVGLYSILHLAKDKSALKDFLERLLDPFVDSATSTRE